MTTVPLQLAEDARAAVAERERRTQEYVRDLLAVHVPLFTEFRTRIQQQFSGNSIPSGEDTPDAPAPRRWAQFPGVAAQLTDDFDALSDALYDADLDQMEDGIDEAMVDGHRRELWLLAEAGLPSPEIQNTLPPKRNRLSTILALGVLGLNWQSRRAVWRNDAKDSVRRWVRATVVSGATLDDTLLGYDRLTRQFSGRVAGLYGDERARAYGVGQDLVLREAEKRWPVQEVWLTRLDKLVCPICAALHGKVTPLQPVTDSHPSCRCVKVPLTANMRPRAIDFEAFLADLDPSDYEGA